MHINGNLPTQIGLIGLVEEEWLVTLATIEPEDLEFIDYVDCARELLPALQQVCIETAILKMILFHIAPL